jgi:hypothetical protein
MRTRMLHALVIVGLLLSLLPASPPALAEEQSLSFVAEVPAAPASEPRMEPSDINPKSWTNGIVKP